MLSIIFTILVVFIVAKLIFGKRLKDYHSNWNTLIDNFEFPTTEFYKLLKEELASHDIHNINMYEVPIKEQGVLSHSRLYLIVEWRGYQYELCGAKFGKGFFVSWWLFHTFSIFQVAILSIPFIGKWLGQQFFPVTHYTQDTASMFMTYAHQSVLEVIKKITSDKGIRQLSETERKPILNDIFKR